MTDNWEDHQSYDEVIKLNMPLKPLVKLEGDELEQAIIDDFVDGQSRKDIAKKYGVTRYKVNKVIVDPKWKEMLDNEEAAAKREMEAKRGKILELLGELMQDENPSIRARAASIMKTFL